VFGLGWIGYPDVDGALAAVVDALGQAAGQQKAVTAAAVLQGIEVDAGHGRVLWC
jgi:hypothetical protein